MPTLLPGPSSAPPVTNTCLSACNGSPQFYLRTAPGGPRAQGCEGGPSSRRGARGRPARGARAEDGGAPGRLGPPPEGSVAAGARRLCGPRAVRRPAVSCVGRGGREGQKRPARSSAVYFITSAGGWGGRWRGAPLLVDACALCALAPSPLAPRGQAGRKSGGSRLRAGLERTGSPTSPSPPAEPPHSHGGG